MSGVGWGRFTSALVGHGALASVELNDVLALAVVARSPVVVVDVADWDGEQIVPAASDTAVTASAARQRRGWRRLPLVSPIEGI